MMDLRKFRRELAHVAGIKTYAGGFSGTTIYVDKDNTVWRPHEDISQSIQVLNSLEGWCWRISSVPTSCEVHLRDPTGKDFEYHDMALTIPEACCLAVIAALGLKGDGE